MRHVIIGAGPAGVVAAETLRSMDATASIVLVNGEPTPPYARMALPYLLSGVIDESRVRLRDRQGFFDDLQIDLVQDQAVGVSVSEARLELANVRGGGEGSLAFDRLLIASGLRPKSPGFPGMDVEGVDYCWTLGDVQRLLSRCTRDAHVVLLGAGFVACIILKALIARGVKATVVTGSSGQLVRTMLCPQASDMLRRWCKERGVSIITGEKVEAIESGPVVGLESGKKLEAEAVIVATGVEANVEFLSGTGVTVEQGVVVDEHFKAHVESGEVEIYAAGDVAQGRSFGASTPQLHPIHPLAVEHGRVAALNMSDRVTSYHGGLQMNALDTAGLPSFSFGRWNGEGGEGREEVESEDQDRYRFIRLCFDGEQLVGANAVGFDREVGALRGLIQTRAPLGGWKAKLLENPFRFSEAFVACTQR